MTGLNFKKYDPSIKVFLGLVWNHLINNHTFPNIEFPVFMNRFYLSDQGPRVQVFKGSSNTSLDPSNPKPLEFLQ